MNVMMRMEPKARTAGYESTRVIEDTYSLLTENLVKYILKKAERIKPEIITTVSFTKYKFESLNTVEEITLFRKDSAEIIELLNQKLKRE